MHTTTELLLRNLHTCVGTSALLVGAPDADLGPLLAARLKLDTLAVFSPDYAVHTRTLAALASDRTGACAAHFGAWYDPPADRHDLAIVFLPKSRALIELTLAMVSAAVRPGGRVVLVGENAAGIKSSRAALSQSVGEVTGSDAARRCTLYTATRGAADPPRARLEDWFESYLTEARGFALTVAGLPGVFSRDRLDDGTRMLLGCLEVPPGARVLDVGCGAGVIGLTAKRLAPDADVDLIDASAYALEAARRTMALANLPDVRIGPSDVFSDVEGRYDLIVSNPPFHTGVHTDYRAAGAFLRGAAARLAPGGAVVLVANRFLPYPALIEEHIGPFRALAEDGRFRVYRGPGR